MDEFWITYGAKFMFWTGKMMGRAHRACLKPARFFFRLKTAAVGMGYKLQHKRKYYNQTRRSESVNVNID